MENHLCICKRWSWKPITGTHWSSVERPSAGLDYWPLRFISPQSPGNYAPSPNMHAHKHAVPQLLHSSILSSWLRFSLVDGEIKMRTKAAFTPTPGLRSSVSNETTGYEGKREEGKSERARSRWSACLESGEGFERTLRFDPAVWEAR